MSSSEAPRVYLDSCIWIAVIQGDAIAERVKALLEKIDRGDFALVESVVILNEVLKGPKSPPDSLDGDSGRTLADIRGMFESPKVVLGDVSLPVARLAHSYQIKFGLKSVDAIHLATAVKYQCRFFISYDKGFERVDLPDIQIVGRSELDSTGMQLPWESRQGMLSL